MPWRNGLYPRLSPSVAMQIRALSQEDARNLEEIRIRLNRPMELVLAAERRRTRFLPERKEMDELIAALSGYALYAYEQQMAQGFIPLPGGHRAGVCGRVTGETGHRRMTEVSSVCIRIARWIHDASKPIRSQLLDASGQPRRVLLLGPPGCGKTTVLRDAIVYLSDTCGLHVAIADEREELFIGVQYGNGVLADVMRGSEKAAAMSMMIRTMAPQVLIADEIGSAADAEAILDAARCGVGVLVSAHAQAIDDVFKRPVLRQLFQEKAFDRYLLLGLHGACIAAYDQDGQVVREGAEAWAIGNLRSWR